MVSSTTDEANIDFASRSFWHIYSQQILRRTHEIPFLIPNSIRIYCDINIQCSFIIHIIQSTIDIPNWKNKTNERN